MQYGERQRPELRLRTRGPRFRPLTLPVLHFVFSLFLYAQSLPPLPQIPLETFEPKIREQIRKAYTEAKAQPQNAAAVGQLAMALHTYEQYEFAAICYERARQLAPEEFRWRHYSGIVQAALGKHREAMEAFRAALRQKPDYIPAQLRLAEALLAQNQFDESQPLYEALAKKNIAQAQYGLGRIKAAKRNTAAAIKHYQTALLTFPTYGLAHYALGLALRDVGQNGEAQEHLRLSQQHKFARPPLDDPLLQAIAELNVGAAEHLRRGVMLDGAGKIAESIAAHERALDINPKLVQAHINLISLYSRAGQNDKAEKQYQAALAINPNLSDLHYNYGVLLVGQRKIAEATEAFARALQLNPFHAESHQNYAVMIEQAGRLEEAAQHYRQAIEYKPGYRLAHFHLGRILVHQEKLTEAIQQFQQTLAPVDEETPRFAYALGATYARVGDRQKAIQYLREAQKHAAHFSQKELLAAIERDLRTLEGK